MDAVPDQNLPRVVVFDFGGVLLDWNPRYLYRKIFGEDEAGMEHFLTHVCSHTWNLMQDAGRTFDEGVAELTERFPQYAELIVAYHQRWEETLSGAHEETVAVLRDLKAAGVPLYGITNYSAEKFAVTRARFDFFGLFDGIVVSGEVKLVKPDPAIFLHFLDRYGLVAGDCVFIDDVAVNTAAASAVGFHAIHHRSAADLRRDLNDLGFLVPETVA